MKKGKSHCAEGLDAGPYIVRSLLGFGDGIGIGHRAVGGRQFLDWAVQLLAAGLVEVLQLGLLPHQVHLDFGALRMALLHAGAQQLEILLARA